MVISNPAWRFSSASNRPAMALLNVSGIRFGDSSASPRPMPAPAKVNDGRIVRWSRAPRPVRKASTRRSHSPAEAVSSMTSHLRALARSPNTVSITVFPVPRAPVTSIMRPGAPTPLSRPFSKSRITLPRPMSRGGSPPAVGLNGFSFGSVKPTLTYERGALIREEVQTFSLWPLLLNGYRYSKARGVHVQHQCSGCGS